MAILESFNTINLVKGIHYDIDEFMFCVIRTRSVAVDALYKTGNTITVNFTQVNLEEEGMEWRDVMEIPMELISPILTVHFKDTSKIHVRAPQDTFS